MTLQHEIRKQKQDRARSIPWSKEQYVYVNRIPCIYDLEKFTKVDLNVHLPGLFTARISALRLMGYRVESPVELRKLEFA